MITEDNILLLKERVREKLNFYTALSDDELSSIIEATVFEWCRQHPLNASARHAAVKRIFHSFRGLDVLQPLLDDASVTEIMINSHEEIFVERSGMITRYGQAFESRERLEDLIQSIVGGVNRIVNEASPIVDARLKDGSRIHVVLPPVALKGPTLTIRRFPQKLLTADDLVRLGTLTADAAALLRTLVSCRYNLFISGGTGTGKTTLLNALSQYIPEGERIVTIEDSAELQLRSIPNLVSLESRNANTEGKGAVVIRDLIRASLRMRPDRIIVGEVRGGEALDMLQAMNTGHEGSISTGHANNTKDMIARLETMVLTVAELPISAIRAQIASAIDVFIHLSRLRDGSRKVTEIAEVGGIHQGEVVLHPLYTYGREGLVEAGSLRRTDKLERAAAMEKEELERSE